MDTQENIDSTVIEFENQFNRFFDEKMKNTKEELTNWIDTKLRQKLAENLELLKGLDEEFYKVRDERDDALLKMPRGDKKKFTARLAGKGGSLKKKQKYRFIKNKSQKKKY